MMRNRLFFMAFGLLFCGLAGAQTYNWTKTLAGADDQNPQAMQVNQSGNVVILTNFRGTVDADPGSNTQNATSAGKTDIILSEWTPDGALVWVKQFGGAGDDYGNNLEIDANGNIIVTGSFEKTVDFNPGTGVDTFNAGKEADLFVLKLNPKGDFKWVNRVECSGYAFVFDTKLDADMNLFVVADFKDTLDMDLTAAVKKIGSEGEFDGLVVSLDSAGKHRWSKVIGGSNTQFISTLCIDKNKMVNLYGTNRGTADLNPDAGKTPHTAIGYSDMFFVRLSNQGFFQFSKVYTGENGSTTFPYKAICDPVTNDIILAGNNKGLADFNAGSGMDTLPNRDMCSFIFRASNLGNPIWLKARPMGNDPKSLMLDKNGNIYITDYSFAKYNADGSLRWDVNIKPGPSGANYKQWAAAAQDNNGIVYGAGYFAFKHNFNVNSGIDSIQATDAYDGFLIKLSDPSINVKTISAKHLIQYFPNPVNDNLKIKSEKYLGKYSIKNAIGAEVMQGEIKGNSGTVFCEKLKPGIYFIQFENGEIKIVKS